MGNEAVESRLSALQTWVLAFHVLSICAVIGVVAFMLSVAVSIRADALETRASLCALRNDVEVRRDASHDYLKANPKGVVSPRTGAVIIPAAQIQQSIHNQNSTLEALASLDCS